MTLLVRGPLSLKLRLLVGVLALIAVTSSLVGIASVSILHTSLVDRVDAQLEAASSRGRESLGQGPNRRGRGDADQAIIAPGQAVGTIAALRVDGTVISAAVLDNEGDAVPLTQRQAASLAAAGTEQPQTVTVAGLGEYRVLAQQATMGADIVLGLPLAAANATSRQLALTTALLAAAALVLAGLVGSWLIRSSLAPLDRVTRAAREVSELPLDRGDVALVAGVTDTDERTEVGQLGAAFNRMIGHVGGALAARESSERKVRQFVADASHELRTPLASIRGYAELTRLSGETLPPDASYALERIEAESVRMTALVEDLLLLARLDEGRELELRPLELSAVLAEVLADARAAGPEHHWRLELAAEPLWVNADESRIRQVLLNLLSNARVHTPAGTAVVVAAHSAGDEVLVLVSDSGPGIDPAVRETLFERFARGDSSRGRAAGSTGLGLAIVDALVRAHGGRIRVESEPGKTVFELSLPRAR